MSDPLHDGLQELIARRAAVRDEDLAPLRGAIAALPPRRRRRTALLAIAASIVLMVGLAGVVLVSLPPGGGGAAPSAPDPAAFEGDPRLASCGARAVDAVAIFEMAHLHDYRLHLRAAFDLVGLQADLAAPALVVVFRGPGGADRNGTTAAPGRHDLCIVVGPDATGAFQSVSVIGVDTTGLVAFLPEPTGTPIAADLAPWADRCGGAEARILAVVTLRRGRDASARITLDPSPDELDTDAPAAVIVYSDTHPFPPLGTPPAAGATIGPREPLAEGHHDLCVLVGADPSTAARTIDEDVAVTFVGAAKP